MAAFDKNAFIQLLLDYQVLKFGEFTLKSGRVSPYFFNAGLLSSGQALDMLACGYADVLADKLGERPSIFGAAYKGIPFVAATAQTLWRNHGVNTEWGYNRKEAKTHGEGGNLVGASLQGKSVWVIDDVMTAGTAIREVVQILKDAGANLAGIVIALDRKEKGQDERSAVQQITEDFGVPVHSLVDIDDIIAFLQAKGETDVLERMMAYRATYGV
ncbi:orotate phosphoribosyltransferase [Moraxella caviae]|uniref:Orotate phosphoribosyltransferase n=1 Tax=Moraxella caviae TaxID=34060 RepID=A0A1S9ZXC6_9GAMM|nr:orotate phosphoribosyltransferase [Moraxella caviae]OOR88093.1 orotate phosphoribosyltransferase [Moraxella caviae]STZ09961.1 Orotate phosphoribosyltransferase [Moraxella caviae]VEW11239.1 Orotate phosphoribosyltransferase [Moraxella caviae]